jgi:hypothetical protein
MARNRLVEPEGEAVCRVFGRMALFGVWVRFGAWVLDKIREICPAFRNFATKMVAFP